MKRILVTGSRDWWNVDAVIAALNSVGPGMVVHGGCPTGADHYAALHAYHQGWPTEVHHAKWDVLGRRAGPIRNREMVESGADVCLAFIRNGSRGATHTANLANEAGILTLRYLEWSN